MTSFDDPQPWKCFEQWLHCICVVAFDLELGQALELVYPGTASMTEKEKMNLCYMAFPDSNSGCMGDTIFHFRMRRTSDRGQICSAHAKYDANCPPPMKMDSSHFYGYVYFRQVKDASITRGYYQKSVVLVTHLPLVNLFTHIVSVVAPEFYRNGEPGLEAACHDIDQWMFPSPGTNIILPLMGTLIHCRIASAQDQDVTLNISQQHVHTSANSKPVILRSVYDPPLYENFSSVLPHIQLLWELVLLGEPLVVMAPSPSVTSSVVHSLVSLISPLSYAYDYRPFFTIHDSEFKEYTASAYAPPRVIVGVTNPFFTKTLQHWPHILKLSDEPVKNKHKASPVSGIKLLKGDIRVLDRKPGLYSQYKPCLTRDNNLVKKLLKGSESKRPAEAQNAMLRRYFLEMTHSFMIPLERYLTILMPLHRQISAFKAAPKPRTFDVDEFLSTLDFSGPALTTGIKGDWPTLYRKFLLTDNFSRWLWQRIGEMEEKLQDLHLQVVCDTNLDSELKTKHEVELVDLLLKLKDKLAYVTSREFELSVRNKLEEQVRIVLSTLNEDTRIALFSSPKHANMSQIASHEESL